MHMWSKRATDTKLAGLQIEISLVEEWVLQENNEKREGKRRGAEKPMT